MIQLNKDDFRRVFILEQVAMERLRAVRKIQKTSSKTAQKAIVGIE